MPNSECWHGHTSRQVGCVSCVIVFGVADGPSEDDTHRPRYRGSRRERFAAALRLAKEATNGWACYAKRQAEHDEIARLHREIARLEGK